MRKRTIGILLGMAVLAFASGRVSTAIDSVYAAEESDTSDDEEDEDEEEEDDSYTKELEQKRNNALDQIKSLWHTYFCYLSARFYPQSPHS